MKSNGDNNVQNDKNEISKPFKNIIIHKLTALMTKHIYLKYIIIIMRKRKFQISKMIKLNVNLQLRN
jgi:hypothetical protein